MPVQVNLPSGGLTDGTANGAPRYDQYNAPWMTPLTSKETNLAAEGSYYTAISGVSPGVPGTGIIGHAAPTTFDETKPYLFIYNGSTLSLYPQFLQLYETVAGVGGARLQLTVARDVGNLYSSGGTAASIQNTSSEGSNNATGITCYQGAVVTAAATSARAIIGNFAFRGTIDIIEDFYQLVWGSPDGVSSSSSRVATVAEVSRMCPPMRIGPGKCLKVHEWRASQSTGPTWEMVFGFVLR